MQRPVLIVGGAPRIQIDAVRFMSVHATGRTAVYLHEQLQEESIRSTALISDDVLCAALPETILRYSDRQVLDSQIDKYLTQNPSAVIVMTAAVNDYDLSYVRARIGEESKDFRAGEKVPSGADELSVHLHPAAKLIDSLAARGHTGPLVACKYEEASTVIEAAEVLCVRVKADFVLANSLCGRIQALVDTEKTQRYESRDAVLLAMLQRIELLVQKN